MGLRQPIGASRREGKDARFEEAKLVVTVSSALSVYLLRRNNPGLLRP